MSKEIKFKIEVGTTFKDKKRDLIIIDREIRKIKNIKYKYYKYHCNIDGNEDWIREDHLLNEVGCNVCANQKAMLGVNTIWDKARWMCDLGVSEKDAKTNMPNSRNKITVICPCCSNIKITTPEYIYRNKSIGCNCKDGNPYTEKFIYYVLMQFKIYFIWQYTKANAVWCDKYKYDFYFVLNGEEYIIEVHGLQHYKENSDFKQSLTEVQENDRIKYELAIKNGIKPENYIVIDFRESTLEWGKEHILESKLNELFDLSIIDWNKCEEYSLKNIIKEVCDYWYEHIEINKEDITTKDLCNIFNLGRWAIIKYLKKGTKLGWCNYDPEEEVRKNYKLKSKTILMYDKNMNFIGEYNGISWLEAHSMELFGVNLDNRRIRESCNNKIPHYKGYIFKYKKDIENIS